MLIGANFILTFLRLALEIGECYLLYPDKTDLQSRHTRGLLKCPRTQEISVSTLPLFSLAKGIIRHYAEMFWVFKELTIPMTVTLKFFEVVCKIKTNGHGNNILRNATKMTASLLSLKKFIIFFKKYNNPQLGLWD